MSSARLRVAAHAGAAAAMVSRSLRLGSGSVIAGRVIETLDPAALTQVLAGRTVALVSGTNGKSTTTAFLCAALRRGGPVVTNAKGANMPAGIVAALALAPPGATAVIEVDEGYLPRLISAAPTAAIVLLNLSRDQLDRVAEVRKVAERWRGALASTDAFVVANADDPCVAFAARSARRVAWVAAGANWKVDAASCPACGARIVFDEPGPGWKCTQCDLARPVDVEVLDEGISLSVPGRHNQLNALMAAVAAEELGVARAEAFDAMAQVSEVEGRYVAVWGGKSEALLYLSKNPAGWIEILNLVDASPRDVMIAINANTADGKDTSWLWDVPFERLRAKRVIAAGTRCRDLALRLRYAEVTADVIADLDRALSAARARDCDVIANYTAFRDVRRSLGQ